MSSNSPLNKIAAQTGPKRTYEVSKKQVDLLQRTWSKCQYLQLSHCKNTKSQYTANPVRQKLSCFTLSKHFHLLSAKSLNFVPRKPQVTIKFCNDFISSFKDIWTLESCYVDIMSITLTHYS